MLQHKAPHRNWKPGPKHLTTYDDVQIPEPPTLFDDWKGRTPASAAQRMTIANHLTKADLKLVKPRGLNEEQLALWNQAYGPKNEAFRKAGLTGKALVRWKYQRYVKDYLRCVASVDDGIGRLLDHLESSGLAKNTIVIYSSDQGWYLGEHGWYDKRWMYEESLRMPLIVRWPGATPKGSQRHEPRPEPGLRPDVPRDGRGRRPPSPCRGAAWCRSFAPMQSRAGAGRSTTTTTSSRASTTWRRHYGVRTKQHKLIHFYRLGDWELYDLAADPDELKNVYADPAYARRTRRADAASSSDYAAHYGVTGAADRAFDELLERRRKKRRKK